jgi:hypothetical protein|tara:strand:+ start:586 stop:2586 length:2001 start_codon:yes stop_codon:yes gene_type:complete
MELPTVAALEFEQLRASIKNYIKTKSTFTDYDFEGSNLSMLVDILAYNTLYTTYNLNMASNELNLDTAVLRDNIVSHAKRLGYNPNSYTSSKVQTDITVSGLLALQVNRIGLKSGPILSTTFQGKNYTFVARDPLNLTVSGDTAVFRDVELYEGTTFSIRYTVDTSNENQRFIIPNTYIDSDSVKVSVKADSTSTTSTNYTRKNTIVGVSPSDTVFFVEEIQDQQYEIVFGDDVIGRKLQNGEIVTIQYIITAGGELNNVKEGSLKFVGTVEYVDSNNVTGKVALSNINFSLNTESSFGGSNFEDIASIKFRAPRYFAAQERAVTISDYESLIMQIYGNADLVKVVGGELLNPPEYGKVFITIKPKVGSVVSDTEKDRIVRDLRSFIVGSVTPVIRDPKKYTIRVIPQLTYNKNKTRKSQATLKKLVRDIVVKYETTDLFKNFGGKFSNSSIVADIQNIDNSIISSNVKVRACVEVDLEINNRIETKYDGSFFTSIRSKLESKYAVVSDFFCYPGQKDPVFIGTPSFGENNCQVDGNLYLIDINGNLLGVVGTIDYETGEFSFSVASCSDEPINICAIPDDPNIDLDDQTYPTIEINDVIVIDPDDGGDPDLSPEDELPVPTPGDTAGDPDAGDGDGDTTDPVTDDPNNIITINDFTPESDPNKCS